MLWLVTDPSRLVHERVRSGAALSWCKHGKFMRVSLDNSNGELWDVDQSKPLS